jgi:uncharacterized membrane protein YvbJ
MFCPACGGQFEGRLNYGKHCGASLTALNQATNRESAERSTETLGWVIVGTSITLLGMALGALVLIKDNAIDASLGKVFNLRSSYLDGESSSVPVGTASGSDRVGHAPFVAARLWRQKFKVVS